MLAKTARALYALRLLDGAIVWTFTPQRGKGEHMYSSPVISGERLFIGDRAGSIHGLDPATGCRLWTTSVADGNVNSTFLVVDGRLVAGTNDSTAVGVDAASGSGGLAHRNRRPFDPRGLTGQRCTRSNRIALVAGPTGRERESPARTRYAISSSW